MKLKNRGFTDTMYVYNLAAVACITIASFAVVCLSGILGITDMSPIVAIISGAYGELSVHTGFIIWKAKSENINKNKCMAESAELDADFEEIQL